MGQLGDLPFDTATASVFLLVLARTSAWAVVAPLVGARTVSGIARIALGVALAGVVTPLVRRETVPSDLPGFATAVFMQVLVGLALGFLTGLLLSAIETAGGLADFASGFSFGAQVDPMSNSQSSVFARFLNMAGLALLAATDGLSTIVAGFVRSFTLLPINGSLHLPPGGPAEVGHLLSQVMLTAMEIAGPLLGALFVTDAGLALVARFVPQANILAVAMPVKALVAFAALGTTLLLLPNQLEALLGPAEKTMHLVLG